MERGRNDDGWSVNAPEAQAAHKREHPENNDSMNSLTAVSFFERILYYRTSHFNTFDGNLPRK
jgi:hypothetical protein